MFTSALGLYFLWLNNFNPFHFLQIKNFFGVPNVFLKLLNGINELLVFSKHLVFSTLSIFLGAYDHDASPKSLAWESFIKFYFTDEKTKVKYVTVF